MKNKIVLASAFLAASSFSTAEIVVNDFLSFEGFVDMSYSHTDTEVDGDKANENSFGLDQVEISWLFDFDPVTAQIDFAHLGSDNARDTITGNGADDTGVEQAFATYHMDNGSAITAGLYASMLGFEAFEPTGLYQYSFGYDMIAANTAILPGYAQGVKYTYETETSFFGLSVQDGISTDRGVGQLGGNNDESTFAIEAAGSLILADGLTGFLGAAYEEGDVDNALVVNSYITFETGAWIFAGEVNYGDFEAGSALTGELGAIAADEEVFQALLMANFAYSEQASVTGRLSYSDHDSDLVGGGSADADFLKYTLAHGYAFTDNLFLVNEISYVDGDSNGADVEGLVGAVELIFSF
jgi:hypothetical protein